MRCGEEIPPRNYTERQTDDVLDDMYAYQSYCRAATRTTARAKTLNLGNRVFQAVASTKTGQAGRQYVIGVTSVCFFTGVLPGNHSKH